MLVQSLPPSTFFRLSYQHWLVLQPQALEWNVGTLVRSWDLMRLRSCGLSRLQSRSVNLPTKPPPTNQPPSQHWVETSCRVVAFSGLPESKSRLCSVGQSIGIHNETNAYYSLTPHACALPLLAKILVYICRSS